ncbi:MAG TPA: hypothetical protein VEC35_13830 [Noviherbaspirillum sp.]|nr:hypothetical protein [Noviherbaspirillum sp.]
MDIRQRARSFLTFILALILAANGLAMLAAPHDWYHATPGVTGTGPLNLHFVRDIGCAYLVAAGGLFWLWRDPQAWRAAIAGSAFLVLHALVHVGEMVFGSFDLHHLLRDLPGVFLIPVFAVWLSWPRTSSISTKENPYAEMARTAPARRF